jgi:flagellar hook-associated protein 1 FlgK
MNLYNLGLSGLEAAQAGLETTSHNINNVVTPGYSRQRVILETAGATATSEGFFGRGVEVETVQRYTNNFIFRQLVSAKGDAAQMAIRYDELSAIDNLFSANGVTPALSNFFASVNAAASKPASLVERQDLINKAKGLVIQVQTVDNHLQDQRIALNNQVAATVEQINISLQRINDLNQKISVARGNASPHAPNDLLDQRDQALTELNQLAGINFYEQDGRVTVMLSGGQTLLSGNTIYPLSAVQSAADPARINVAYSIPAGPGVMRSVELADAQVTGGGKLSGLLEFRIKSLNPIQDRLGQFAIGIAMAFNAQHTQGLDLNGMTGGDFFAVRAPAAIPNAGNAGSAVLQSSYVDVALIQASPYKIAFDGINFSVTRLSDNVQVYSAPPVGGVLSFDGLSVDVTGVATIGDSWILRATRNAASEFTQLVTDPMNIALADSTGGSANGNNGLVLAKLQTAPVFSDGISLNAQVARLVNYVGVQTQQAKTATTMQKTLVQQTYSAAQSVSGVNVNEESVNLTIWQNQYRANAKVIETANIIMDTLLRIRL